MKKTLFLLAFAALFTLECSAETFDSEFKGTTSIKLTGTFSAETIKELDGDDRGRYSFIVFKYYGTVSRNAYVNVPFKSFDFGKKDNLFDISWKEKNGKLKFNEISTYPLKLAIRDCATKDLESKLVECVNCYSSSIKCSGTFKNVDTSKFDEGYGLQLLDYSCPSDYLFEADYFLDKKGKNFISKFKEAGVSHNVKITSKGKVTYTLKCDENYIHPEFMKLGE